MKNREFIKKSIEENIVDKSAVLGNLKAKAHLKEKQTKAFAIKRRTGLKKAAILCALVIVSTSLIVCSTLLINPDNSYAAYKTDSSVHNNTGLINDNSVEDIITSSVQSIDSTDQSTVDEDSKYPQCSSEASESITKTPLDFETQQFFESFSVEFRIFQNIINTNISYSDTTTEETYVKITDGRFKSLSDIRRFLYSFLTPELAGTMYNNLTCGKNPKYMEMHHTLNMNIKDYSKPNKIIGISTEDAYISSTTDNKLVIHAMLETQSGQYYFHRFNFVKIDNKWVYNDNWC